MTTTIIASDATAETLLKALEAQAKKAESRMAVMPLTSDLTKWEHLHDTDLWPRAYVMVSYRPPLKKHEQEKVSVPHFDRRYVYTLHGDEFMARELKSRAEVLGVIGGDWHEAIEAERSRAALAQVRIFR